MLGNTIRGVLLLVITLLSASEWYVIPTQDHPIHIYKHTPQVSLKNPYGPDCEKRSNID